MDVTQQIQSLHECTAEHQYHRDHISLARVCTMPNLWNLCKKKFRNKSHNIRYLNINHYLIGHTIIDISILLTADNFHPCILCIDWYRNCGWRDDGSRSCLRRCWYLRSNFYNRTYYTDDVSVFKVIADTFNLVWYFPSPIRWG